MKVALFFIFILSLVWLGLVWHAASHQKQPSRFATERDASQTGDNDTAEESAPPKYSKLWSFFAPKEKEPVTPAPTPVPVGANLDRYAYLGEIHQHIDTGGLLVRCYRTQHQPNSAMGEVALFGHPLENRLGDGESLVFEACKTGIYKYNTDKGKVRTVTKVVYAMPTPVPPTPTPVYRSPLESRPVRHPPLR